MPRRRTVVVAVIVGLTMAAYLNAWVRWPSFIAIAVGAVMAVVILLIAASLEDDAASADAAWRAATVDLDRHRPAEPSDDGSPSIDRSGEAKAP